MECLPISFKVKLHPRNPSRWALLSKSLRPLFSGGLWRNNQTTLHSKLKLRCVLRRPGSTTPSPQVGDSSSRVSALGFRMSFPGEKEREPGGVLSGLCSFSRWQSGSPSVDASLTFGGCAFRSLQNFGGNRRKRRCARRRAKARDFCENAHRRDFRLGFGCACVRVYERKAIKCNTNAVRAGLQLLLWGIILASVWRAPWLRCEFERRVVRRDHRTFATQPRSLFSRKQGLKRPSLPGASLGI